MSADHKIHAVIDYEDKYVQPLLLAALKARLPPELLVILQNEADLPSTSTPLLQWRQYESIDFDRLLSNPNSMFANSYVIRKALIRKHYLSSTIAHWLTKNPDSVLADHVKPSVEFEVDYAEFLDDALIEAYELKESWARNEGREAREREWWILKPGMSERGQGIRLFSSEAELTAIFEEWDTPSDDDDEDKDDGANDDDGGSAAAHSGTASNDNKAPAQTESPSQSNGIITSQLRHFIAQPYIAPPLLLPAPHPSAGRKFHIRTYVLAVGALKVYVYRSMLALFAGHEYRPPGTDASPNDVLGSHLTNTCLQSGEREGSVCAFWSLPQHLPSLPPRPTAAVDEGDWREEVFTQIRAITAAVFEAAARSSSIHFQPLPNAFELFGVDFLVDAEGKAWLLEVNAFPDFAQTGDELKGVIGGLFEEVVEVAVWPFFGVNGTQEEEKKRGGQMVEVLDIDLGRR